MSHFGFFTCENGREKKSQQKHDKAVFEMFSGGPRAAGHSQVLSVAWRSKLVGLYSRWGKQKIQFHKETQNSNHEIPELFSGYSYSTRAHTLFYRLWQMTRPPATDPCRINACKACDECKCYNKLPSLPSLNLQFRALWTCSWTPSLFLLSQKISEQELTYSCVKILVYWTLYFHFIIQDILKVY